MRVTMRTQRAAFLSPGTMRRKGPAVSGTDLQNRINRMATCLPVLGMGDYGSALAERSGDSAFA
jgi:hypothetical protein